MHYILSQKEYDALKAAKKFEITLDKEKLQKLCTKIADEMPVSRKWDKDNKDPWGCIITEGDGEWYCDDCPVQDICPYEWKEWSK